MIPPLPLTRLILIAVGNATGSPPKRLGG